MALIDILLSAKFLLALSIYAVLVMLILPLMFRVYNRTGHSLSDWILEHVAMPLTQVAMLIIFILFAYPLIFGIEEAPSIISLLSQDELRINYLINLLFVISLFFPLMPIIGNWHELILPVQGIAASMLIFSWLAASRGMTQYSYWPGWKVLIWCLVVGIITHWLAVNLAGMIGHKLDKIFHVRDSGELLSRGLILLMQSPVILIFSEGLGSQL